MMKSWRQLEQSYANLSRRERVILLVGGVMVLLLIGYSQIDASLTKQRLLEHRISATRNDVSITQAQIQTIVRQLGEDPDERARAQIVRLTEEVRELDAQMQGVNRGLVPPQQMAAILKKMLARSSRVKLVRLKTLPVDYLIQRGEGDKGANVYKHGIEMTLEGGYLDLLAYLDDLEELPWQMFWAKADMNAQNYPAVRITVTVYTLSLDKNWLVV